MADRSEKITTGIVIEALPNATFRVKLSEEDKEIFVYISGKMRIHRIKVLIGDKVKVKITPYDETKGRIIQRL